ncbi:tRNase Z endonuclease [Arabidopsis thaliana x Arabidopsis arenosa]|uniref:ribonuclease Z n=1 Tax=Arabidopsis thaliana x Arabidopsis arenosa TaxID=1240361 RepID=A0A8T2C769_9BRAS|nr:tRNase Z endonuclease [Arabidopsis thaliana x Arabidopsis arenosa]
MPYLHKNLRLLLLLSSKSSSFPLSLRPFSPRSFSLSTLFSSSSSSMENHEAATNGSKSSNSFVFNKRRAEGFDKIDKKKRNLERKTQKLNPSNTIAYAQILGTGMDTQDTSSSVLLFFDKQRFIFNAGEGLQRFCTEHKIKLSKIDHVFLSRVCSETAGGLPGLLLTLAGIGEEGLSVNVWGPSDLNYLVDAMKSFIPRAAMVHTRSFGPSSTPDPIVLVNDEVVKISAIILKPCHSEEDSGNKSGELSVVYVCELPEILGKFDLEKAKKIFGVKPGPKYSKLQSGESVKSDERDITVYPSDVMGPSLPGPIVLLVDCPTESHAEELFSVKSLESYYSCPDDQTDGAKFVNCIIHLSPSSVTSSPTYQSWMNKFHSSQHILAGHQRKNMAFPILKASSRITARLNCLCPQFFPAPGFWPQLADMSMIDSTPWNKCSSSNLAESISAENLLKFNLRPVAIRGIDRSCIPARLTSSEVLDELFDEIPEIKDKCGEIMQFWNKQHDKTIIEKLWLTESNTVLPSCLENIRRDDMEIVILGTGSSQPSKYRNVSAIYIDLFSRGSLLLDCGEGTLGQLKRRYGLNGADEAVRKLRCIWISHIHADHHTGLARILALRSKLLKGVTHEPVIVVGPRPLKRFLDAYQRLEDLDMEFLDCRSTTETSWASLENGGGDAEGSLFSEGIPMQSVFKRSDIPTDNSSVLLCLKNLKKVLSEIGLDDLISFPVVHCPQAYGVVIKAAERVNSVGERIPGWKMVYSGDTRPCPETVEASRDATVLIHEATFEDALIEEALAKNHSTTKEAIDVGSSANAYRIVLTHFSQRYPKIPVIDESHMHNTCIAFDLMSINMADLQVLPKVLPYFKTLFRDEMVEDEDADGVAIEEAW